MSWLFSRVLVEEYWEAICLDGEQSAPLSGNLTPQAYLSPDKMTKFSRLSRFGMTFKPLTESRGEELLMLYRAGFHAKTSALLEKEQVLTESAVECGHTWRGWLAKFDPSSCSWKTAQCSLLGDSIEFSLTLPRSGMTRGGLLWELPMLERHTSETGFGLSLKWPTPTAHNAKEGAFPAEYTRNTPTLSAQVGGKLNPMWVEWLMGWPLGWTDLKPLETVKFLCAPQKPLHCFPADLNR